MRSVMCVRARLIGELRTIYGQLKKVQKAFSVRKRHQKNHLGFWTPKLQTRRSGVRVPPGAPLLIPFSFNQLRKYFLVF